MTNTTQRRHKPLDYNSDTENKFMVSYLDKQYLEGEHNIKETCYDSEIIDVAEKAMPYDISRFVIYRCIPDSFGYTDYVEVFDSANRQDNYDIFGGIRYYE